MSSGAWIFRKAEQVNKDGEDGGSWYVGWYEPNGRHKAESCGPGVRGKDKAQRLKRKIESQLMEAVGKLHVPDVLRKKASG